MNSKFTLHCILDGNVTPLNFRVLLRENEMEYRDAQNFKIFIFHCHLLPYWKRKKTDAAVHKHWHGIALLQLFYMSFRAVASLTVPGGQEFHFPHFFPKFWSFFSYFSSNFSHFLPHFGSPGGRLAHPGRSWLRHWWAYMCIGYHMVRALNIKCSSLFVYIEFHRDRHKHDCWWERGHDRSIKALHN